MATEENNTQAIDEALTLLDRARNIPVYKVAEDLGILDRMKDYYNIHESGAQQFNQMIGDAVSSAYNLVGVPLNKLGEGLGYSPGYSGERVMQDWFGWSGYKPRGDVDAPFGTKADRVPFKEQPLGELVKAYLDKNITATDSPALASQDPTVSEPSDISDERRAWLEEFWTFPEERRTNIMAKLDDKTKADLQAHVPATDEEITGTYDYITKVK